MEALIGWLALSLAVVSGIVAHRKGRSGFLFTIISILFTPIIGLPIALLVGNKKENAESHNDLHRNLAGDVTHNITVSAPSGYRSYSGEPQVRGRPNTSASCWVATGTETKVSRFTITSGMIYVGKNLPQANGSGYFEPSLINPSLKVSKSAHTRDGYEMSYWPSYSTIEPEDRAVYLQWLSTGREDPNVAIGYVFLFFYGLERRALFDATRDEAARQDVPAIKTEVERLVRLFGKSRSFQNYASSFLDFLEARTAVQQDAEPILSRAYSGYEFPASLKVAVGRMAIGGRRLPDSWALAWVRLDPEIRLRTPARRCEEEFNKLFLLEYRERHGEGIKLTNCKRRLRLEYQPATATFAGRFSHDIDLPDVTRLVGPRRKLIEIADACSDALDSYSRFLGKNPDQAGTVAAAAFLPEQLVEEYAPTELKELREDLHQRLASEPLLPLPAEEVIGNWLPEDGGKQTKRAAVDSAKLLALLGIGLSPDVRFSGARIGRGDRVILFRLPEGSGEAPTTAYRASLALIHLATMVSASDGSISEEEEEHIKDYLAQAFHLDLPETTRLTASLQWMLLNPPSGSGLKKRLEALPLEQRTAVARFLVGVAWADGRIDPDEVKMLSKLYRVLGLEPTSVHDDIQSMHSSAGADSGPVTIRPAAKQGGYRVPPPEKTPAHEGVTLDANRIQYIEGETAKLIRTLSTVFEGEDEGAEIAPAKTAASVHGLDSAHSTLLARLGAKESWDRDSYDALVEELGLFPGSALEVINDVAFDVCDEPLLEGDDPLLVNKSVLKEVIG